MRNIAKAFCVLISVLVAGGCASRHGPAAVSGPGESQADRDARMGWWRDARFGMFIHWGLYAIPAGKWGDKTGHGEWIRDTAHIPVEEYERFKDQFNPVKFNADAWVGAAKGAGMRYVTITTKHHDGFCLFDSKETDWDVMSTPFKRDVMREMSEACRRQGVTMCWYHSIMDWHHPDYLPRRPWENRPTEGADFDRFNRYLKAQVKELLTNYGPIGVMWFDGQWEGTWTHERGLDLAAWCRSLSPRTIVNNRVDKGGGAFGMTRSGEYAGDFGTPEQEIPPTGLPGVDWETCMTMNDHWGYNAADHNFKTTRDLIRKLADIASKGGNFLLNVGPTAEGEIPPTSLERLREIGRWMDVNGDSIHGTQAGPFEGLAWGRCTQRAIVDRGRRGTRLYLHVFDWPGNGRLVVPGLFNDATGAHLMAGPDVMLAVSREDDSLVIAVPARAPDADDSVVVLDIEGVPDVARAPEITAATDIFVGSHEVTAASARQNVQVRYTLDGTAPTPASALARGPIRLYRTATVSARAFRGERAVSPTASRTFTKVDPAPSLAARTGEAGLRFAYYEGSWDKVPRFEAMQPKATGIAQSFDRAQKQREEEFGLRYEGLMRIPADGVYTLSIASDDGSNLYVDGKLLVDNDGLHSLQEKSGSVALAAGLHALRVDFFEKSGGNELGVWISGPGMAKRKLTPAECVVEAK